MNRLLKKPGHKKLLLHSAFTRVTLWAALLLTGLSNINAQSLDGSSTPCSSASYIYKTDTSQLNYLWTITGGTLTSGGGSTNSTATVKWASTMPGSISVSYSGGITKTEFVYPVSCGNISASVTAHTSATNNCDSKDGSLTITASGGDSTGIYYFVLNGPTPVSRAQTSPATFNYLTGGSYSILVYNASSPNGADGYSTTIVDSLTCVHPCSKITGGVTAYGAGNNTVYLTDAGYLLFGVSGGDGSGVYQFAATGPPYGSPGNAGYLQNNPNAPTGHGYTWGTSPFAITASDQPPISGWSGQDNLGPPAGAVDALPPPYYLATGAYTITVYDYNGLNGPNLSWDSLVINFNYNISPTNNNKIKTTVASINASTSCSADGSIQITPTNARGKPDLNNSIGEYYYYELSGPVDLSFIGNRVGSLTSNTYDTMGGLPAGNYMLVTFNWDTYFKSGPPNATYNGNTGTNYPLLTLVPDGLQDTTYFTISATAPCPSPISVSIYDPDNGTGGGTTPNSHCGAGDGQLALDITGGNGSGYDVYLVAQNNVSGRQLVASWVPYTNRSIETGIGTGLYKILVFNTNADPLVPNPFYTDQDGNRDPYDYNYDSTMFNEGYGADDSHLSYCSGKIMASPADWTSYFNNGNYNRYNPSCQQCPTTVYHASSANIANGSLDIFILGGNGPYAATAVNTATQVTYYNNGNGQQAGEDAEGDPEAFSQLFGETANTNGGEIQFANNLPAGTYTVTVFDASYRVCNGFPDGQRGYPNYNQAAEIYCQAGTDHHWIATKVNDGLQETFTVTIGADNTTPISFNASYGTTDPCSHDTSITFHITGGDGSGYVVEFYDARTIPTSSSNQMGLMAYTRHADTTFTITETYGNNNPGNNVVNDSSLVFYPGLNGGSYSITVADYDDPLLGFNAQFPAWVGHFFGTPTANIPDGLDTSATVFFEPLYASCVINATVSDTNNATGFCDSTGSINVVATGGASLNQYDYTAYNYTNGQQYSGTEAGNLIHINGLTPGFYFISIYDAGSHNDGDSASVFTYVYDDTTTSILNVTNNCGNSILTATNYTGTLVWSDSIIGGSPRYVTAAGTYSVQQSTGCGLSPASNRVIAAPLPPPTPPIISANDTSICSSDTAIITAPANYTSYSWNDGDTTNYTYANSAGNYWVTVTDSSGCSAISNYVGISVYPVQSVSIEVNGDTLSSSAASFYQWYFNDSVITGAVSPVYIAPEAGDYAVQITDTNGCKALSANAQVIVTGLNEVNENSLNIYPNPFTNIIFIGWNNTATPIKAVEVFDLLGQKLAGNEINGSSQGLSSLDVSILSPGTYFVRIYTNNSSYLKEMIKE